MKLYELVKAFAIAFLIGTFPEPDLPDEMKPERIQFWEEQISPVWMKAEGGNALVRTIIRGDQRAADNLAKEMVEELEQYGYEPDDLDVDGKTVTVRLTSAGTLTERDYAAALLIDLFL